MRTRRRECIAVHRFLADVLRGARPWESAEPPAHRVPGDVWQLVVGYERCGAQVHAALAAAGALSRIPAPVQTLLRACAEDALRQSLACIARLQQVALIAAEAAIPVIALKGSARLLSGERAGLRTIADVDLLAAPGKALALHGILKERLNLIESGDVGTHHLPPLVAPGAPPVEVHHSVSSEGGALDTLMWSDAREVNAAGIPMLVPSPTAHLLHTLEHAAVGHWTARHRLRGIADVASAWSSEVDQPAVLRHVRASAHRRELQVMLSAAHDINASVPKLRGGAWNHIERSAAASFAAASLPIGGVAGIRLMNWGGALRGSGARDLAAYSGRMIRRLISAGALIVRCLGSWAGPAALRIRKDLELPCGSGGSLKRVEADWALHERADPAHRRCKVC